MISVSNYLKSLEIIDTRKLPEVLQEGHQFFIDVVHLYQIDETVKETLDLYLKSLNEHLANKKSNMVNSRRSKNRPAKDLTFIERFINLHNNIQTKQQIGIYIKALQQAIVRKEISKSSSYADHIEQIQKKLINRYNILPENGTVKISINKQWLAELKEIIMERPSSIDYLNSLYSIDDHNIAPIKPKKRALGIFDSMDEIESEPSESTFRLEGELGIFLGDLERFELAMTIEGDQGGGKTRLAYQLANAFADFGDTVAVFSLEIGKKSDLIRRMREDYIEPENLKNIFIADQLPNGLATIKEAAKKFDVIVLDSWNKVGVPSIEFDRLRKEYPDTIFLVIFQRTTQKTIRGGTAPLFDAGINIEVVKVDDSFVNNYAVATKNRYGVAGIRYNISQQTIESNHSKEPSELKAREQNILSSI